MEAGDFKLILTGTGQATWVISCFILLSRLIILSWYLVCWFLKPCADAVIFSDDSEQIYKQGGLEKFQENETNNENIPLREGPFGKFIKLLSNLQKELNQNIIRIAIVTARSYPSNIRVIKTLRSWGVNVDEAFFLGGLPKDKILKAFNAHIFFDDQDTYVLPASNVVPSSRVPYKSDSPLAVRK